MKGGIKVKFKLNKEVMRKGIIDWIAVMRENKGIFSRMFMRKDQEKIFLDVEEGDFVEFAKKIASGVDERFYAIVNDVKGDTVEFVVTNVLPFDEEFVKDVVEELGVSRNNSKEAVSRNNGNSQPEKMTEKQKSYLEYLLEKGRMKYSEVVRKVFGRYVAREDLTKKQAIRLIAEVKEMV
jgi:hypothetical protein